MTKPQGNPNTILKGFHIGPVVAAILVAEGMMMLMAALSWLFESLIVDAFNSIVRLGRFEIVGLKEIPISWLLISMSAVPAIVLVFCGIRLGAWLSEGSTSKGA